MDVNVCQLINSMDALLQANSDREHSLFAELSNHDIVSTLETLRKSQVQHLVTPFTVYLYDVGLIDVTFIANLLTKLHSETVRLVAEAIPLIVNLSLSKGSNDVDGLLNLRGLLDDAYLVGRISISIIPHGSDELVTEIMRCHYSTYNDLLRFIYRARDYGPEQLDRIAKITTSIVGNGQLMDCLFMDHVDWDIVRALANHCDLSKVTYGPYSMYNPNGQEDTNRFVKRLNYLIKGDV